MHTLQTLCCKSYLKCSPIGSTVPYDYIPGTMMSWIKAWIQLMGYHLDRRFLEAIQETITNRSYSKENFDYYFKEDLNHIASSFGMYYNVNETTDITSGIRSGWTWKVNNFPVLNSERVLKETYRRKYK
jgi:hypothetical protein